MSYIPQTWVNKPTLTTPVGATRLNYMEAGIAAAKVDYPTVNRTLSFSNGGQGGQSALYVAGTATTLASVTALSFRFPFVLPADVTSFYVDIANYNTGGSAAGTNTLTLVKACAGQATARAVGDVGPTGNFLGNTATTLASSGTIPTNGGYLTLGPFTTDLPKDGVDWLLAIAATCSSQTLSTGIGKVWRWANSTSATDPTVASSGGTASWVPLDVVVRYTTSNNKKGLLVIGDSIPEGSQGPSWAMTGARTDIVPTPLSDRFFDQWAARRGDWMVQNHSLYGAFAQTWASSSYRGWTRLATSGGAFDAAVLALGCNDIALGRTVAQIQADFISCLTNLRAIVGTSVPIYALNYTPYNTYTTTMEGYRKTLNGWLAQRPAGIAGCIDVESGSRVTSATATLTTATAYDTQLTCDGTHPSYEGTERIVQAVTAAMPMAA